MSTPLPTHLCYLELDNFKVINDTCKRIGGGEPSYLRRMSAPSARRYIYSAKALHLLSPVRRHHQYSNFSAAIDGERATATIYMVARHWKATDGGSAEYTQNGWYENSFARIDRHWKITRLLHTFQWVSGNGGLFDFSDPELVKIMGQVFAPENRVKR
jgi:uncharacterized protein affecting Mg2+/Co2+ transport